MEQGIWLVNARGMKVHGNTIRTGCFTYGAPISTEFNVGESEFYGNQILGCLNTVVGGANSFDIYIHDNVFYSYDGNRNDFASFSDESMGVGELANRQGAGAIFQKSLGNKEKNNTLIPIQGTLAEEMKENVAYAHEHGTYQAKGWIACEKADGSIDEACRRREEAQGDQGVPREQLLYSSLMEDFEAFADKGVVQKILSVFDGSGPEEKEIIAQDLSQEEATGMAYVIEQLRESWKATLGVIISIVVFLSVGYIIIKKRKVSA
jgi:hypothetical protein